ncbi:MAG: hypothetical protein ACYTKD_16975 [Planctomycetota bacterium]
MNDIQGKNAVPGFEARAFPCQELTGQYAMLPIDAEPVYNEEDGKWYLDGELVVCANFKKRERAKNKAVTPVVDKSATEKAITNLEPEVLGDETN